MKIKALSTKIGVLPTTIQALDENQSFAENDPRSVVRSFVDELRPPLTSIFHRFKVYHFYHLQIFSAPIWIHFYAKSKGLYLNDLRELALSNNLCKFVHKDLIVAYLCLILVQMIHVVTNFNFRFCVWFTRYMNILLILRNIYC
ncbi:LOW QUALITY PROTEIN: hypothetical protein TorRG33x02_348260 [Trema orientale]|uniref:Uncharacterized protein n=1 Tax=Trema orientale TaxID=63057 RepID=A0A2P5AKC2_TREOI|nr:LOW QUALITY PROTEIN: hypothetical protein TorRG33x02_348260 [Trema orientale]